MVFPCSFFFEIPTLENTFCCSLIRKSNDFKEFINYLIKLIRFWLIQVKLLKRLIIEWNA